MKRGKVQVITILCQFQRQSKVILFYTYTLFRLFSIISYCSCSVTNLCPTLCNCMKWSLLGSSVHGIFTSRNTGVGCHSLLQGISPTQVSNLRLLSLLRWQADSLLPVLPGKSHYRLLQDIKYCSLCYTVNPCSLLYICSSVSVNPIFLIYPPPFPFW